MRLALNADGPGPLSAWRVAIVPNSSCLMTQAERSDDGVAEAAAAPAAGDAAQGCTAPAGAVRMSGNGENPNAAALFEAANGSLNRSPALIQPDHGAVIANVPNDRSRDARLRPCPRGIAESRPSARHVGRGAGGRVRAHNRRNLLHLGRGRRRTEVPSTDNRCRCACCPRAHLTSAAASLDAATMCQGCFYEVKGMALSRW